MQCCDAELFQELLTAFAAEKGVRILYCQMFAVDKSAFNTAVKECNFTFFLDDGEHHCKTVLIGDSSHRIVSLGVIFLSYQYDGRDICHYALLRAL